MRCELTVERSGPNDLASSSNCSFPYGVSPAERDKSPAAVMAAARRRADEARERDLLKKKQEALTPQQMFLPGMGEIMRATSNPIARCSLYAPIARGPRKFHREATLVTRADVVMSYTGEQLDEADADLSFQLFYEARHSRLGEPVTINRAAFLRSMGRSTGKHDYEWLHRRMKAHTVATLFIEAKNRDGSTKYRIGATEAFHILQSFRYDEDTESYTFTLDPRWRALFSNKEYALIDWHKRMQIRRGQDMAKALQRLLATSSDAVQRYALDWLKAKMQYAGRVRDFKDSLKRATQELERVEVIANSRIEISTKGKEQLTVWLFASG